MFEVRRGVGHGKLLLFGEHAAVYGRPACGITLPFTMSVQIIDTEAGGWQLSPAIGSMRERLAGFLASIDRDFPEHSLLRGLIEVESNIPIGSGFGSSAAWCIAFARAAFAGSLSQEELWLAAHRAERFFHGTPSGIDTGLALLEGLYALSPAPPALPTARRLRGLPLELIVGSTPREGSTRELVGALRARLEAGDEEARRLVDTLGNVSERAIEVLDQEKGEVMTRIEELGTLANRAQRALASLGLSTRAAEELLDEGLRLGAVGGKLSGAGGGGAFYLLFRDPQAADRAFEELSGSLRPASGVMLFRFSMRD